MNIHYIKHNKSTVAYIIKNAAKIKGKEFIDRKNDFLQVGLMNLKKDEEIRAHYHLHQNKNITKNQEVLIILEGEMKVYFYSNKSHQPITTANIISGDILVLLNCGHGFKIIKPTKLIEVKQGPYEGQNKDKSFIKKNYDK